MNYRPIFICQYAFTTDSCNWHLTDSRTEAATLDENFQLASVEDLHDWVAATEQVFIGILSVREGLCKWIVSDSFDDFGETVTLYEYQLI